MNKIILATALSAVALAAAPAFAQTAGSEVTGYIDLGYAHLDPNGADLNTLGGRVGARYGRYIGLEGEAFFGVGADNTTVPSSAGAIQERNKLDHAIAGYLVGYYPVTPRFDLFARVGYGNTHFNQSYSGIGAGTLSEDSINYGAGAQYFFTGKDGVRAEYTRDDYRSNFPDANVWSVSYVRKF